MSETFDESLDRSAAPQTELGLLTQEAINNARDAGSSEEEIDDAFGWLIRRNAQVQGLRNRLSSIEEGSETTALRDHQANVYEDLVDYLEQAGTSGYIKLPTGTGKTAIFVELCKTLIENARESEALATKVLILVPTKDLVLQTIGDERKRGGFSKFAPDVEVRPYYSDIAYKERMKNVDAEVLVSTYDSFNLLMKERAIYSRWTDPDWENQRIRFAEKQEAQLAAAKEIQVEILGFMASHPMATLVGSADHDFVKQLRAEKRNAKNAARMFGRMIEGSRRKQQALEQFEKFEYVICDEAHRSIGPTILSSVKKFADDGKRILIGLTATDEYTDKSLATEFGDLIHEMDIKEALELGLLNSLALYKFDTGIDYQDVRLNSIGEFDESFFETVMEDASRNAMAVEIVAAFVEAGLSGVVSTIPGEKTLHARIMSSLLRQKLVTDPKTGKQRHIRAAAISGTTKPLNRQLILKRFEEGRIDFLTFVDVLREGWDSDIAKVLVNLRPTRSPLLATQRMGRVLRQSSSQPISYVVDFYDNYYTQVELSAHEPVPAVTAIDALGLDKVQQGTILGINSKGDEDHHLRQALGTVMAEPYIQPIYTQYIKHLKETPQVSAGRSLVEYSDGQRVEWLTAEKIQNLYSGYFPPKVLQAFVDSVEPEVRTKKAIVSGRIADIYNFADIRSLKIEGPVINPDKLYIDEAGVKWITPAGCKKLVSKILPSVDENSIRSLIEEIDVHDAFEWQTARVRISYLSNVDRFGYTEIYKLEDILGKLVPKIRSLKESA